MDKFIIDIMRQLRDYNVPIGKRIKILMIMRGYTQHDMAQRSGYSQSRISDFCKMEHVNQFHSLNMLSLSTALDIEGDVLFGNVYKSKVQFITN